MATRDRDQRISELLGALGDYRAACQQLLKVLGPRQSNRDLQVEFAAALRAAFIDS
jgi:hypothetical protein